MSSDPYDPRAVANLLLDEAERLNVRVSHLVLQKLLYFAHGLFLISRKRPLVSGYFEAWQHGPVHPAVYKAFKAAGSEPISSRARAQDPLTGETRPIAGPTDPEIRQLMQRVLVSYGLLSPGRLVDISHAKDSPWAYIVDKSRTDVAFGLRISDNVIAERFRFHKISVGDEPKAGEPFEDSPLT